MCLDLYKDMIDTNFIYLMKCNHIKSAVFMLIDCDWKEEFNFDPYT